MGTLSLFSRPCVTVMNVFDHLRLALFSGKGGVGKTTLSCGFARRWAQQFPAERILLLSTDPAHSLGDVLRMEVGDRPQPMADLPNLRVRSLDADALLNAFRAEYGKVLELLVERGSFVQGEDLSPVWDLSWPGLDELMGILEIQRLLRDGDVDRIVVDMAPSGHTLNLFGLMDFLDNLLSALDRFQEKHRVIGQRFTGRHAEDEADRFLLEMTADLANGRSLLQNPAQTACLVVGIPEPLSWLETRRFITALDDLKIAVGGIFVNHVVAENSLNAAVEEQQELLSKFVTLAEPLPVWQVPQQEGEPVGAIALDQLMERVAIAAALPAVQRSHQTWLLPPKYLPSLCDFVSEGRRLLIIGGKGGVGKTTVAAAIAWGMAAHHPQQSVRVISIDPAHSLGDAVSTPLSHIPLELTANLSAQEVDAEQVLDQFREDYLWELAEMMSGDSASDDSMQLAYGPEAWRQIVAQALPGIDEMLSLVAVMELLERNAQDLIILDTAPTGHLLRFLQMPTALGDWLGWIFKLWIKYQDVAGHVELMGRLRSLRQRVMQAQKRLKDPAYTEFIGVLQAQSAIWSEAERLARSLLDLGISQRYLVHNRYEVGNELPEALFPQHQVVQLGMLPRGMAPIEQVKAAATLLF
jgi:arsenite/tail-anchored protein-transporting ATPase